MMDNVQMENNKNASRLMGSGNIIEFNNVFSPYKTGDVFRVVEIKPDGSFILEQMKTFVLKQSISGNVSSLDGKLVINSDHREVLVEGKLVNLTPTEWKLLEILYSVAKKPVSNTILLNYTWGPEYIDDLQYLRVWISRIRAKIGDKYIKTHSGFGYQFILDA